MLSVINPSQIQPGGHSTFPRPANPVSHNLSSSYNNISSTSSSNNSIIGHTISCNVSAFPVNSNFQARSSSNSVGDNIRNHNMIFALSNSNSFNPTTDKSSPPYLFTTMNSISKYKRPPAGTDALLVALRTKGAKVGTEARKARTPFNSLT